MDRRIDPREVAQSLSSLRVEQHGGVTCARESAIVVDPAVLAIVDFHARISDMPVIRYHSGDRVALFPSLVFVATDAHCATHAERIARARGRSFCLLSLLRRGRVRDACD